MHISVFFERDIFMEKLCGNCTCHCSDWFNTNLQEPFPVLKQWHICSWDFVRPHSRFWEGWSYHPYMSSVRSGRGKVCYLSVIHFLLSIISYCVWMVKFSSAAPLSLGVPHGSIFRLILFPLYIFPVDHSILCFPNHIFDGELELLPSRKISRRPKWRTYR